jgi:spore maturation protein CgeB
MLAGRRMVLVTENWFGSSGRGLACGFRANGWAVHEIENSTFFTRAGTTAGRLVVRLMRPLMIKAYNDAILTAVEQLRPQALVITKGTYINPGTLERIARMRVAAVNYYPDFHFDHSGFNLATLPLYALVVTTKSFQVRFLQQLVGAERVVFLHHGYSDLVHFPRFTSVDEAGCLADVTYVGNYALNKEQWLRSIVRRLPGIRLRVVGSRWEHARDDALKRCAIGHGLLGDFYARAVQQSRINIAVHGERSKREGWQDLVSTRTFEIPACKGFMLHIDNHEVRELFEPGREIDVFASEDELIEKITHYLGRPELRREMIERAYARCVPAYGYNARAVLISRVIASLSCAPAGAETPT